jgi:ubiquinone/menaquinone biosynthesis C-methylase UbiE
VTTSPPQPEIITRLFDAVYPSFSMLAGMELDLFTQLAEKPLSAEQIADAIGVQVMKLRPLLYALVVAGLLTVKEELFANTPEANLYLVSGKPAYLGGITGLTANNWARILKTAATIRVGGTLEKYDYHAPSTDELVALFRGLYAGAVTDAHRLMEHHDLSPYNTLLDVGGGSGALAIALAQANPHLKATVVDLPSVIPITQQFVEEAKAADRVNILSGDAVRDTLSGSYDVVVARHVIQVLSEDDSRALLSKLSAVIKPSGVIHLIGWILDNSRLSPQKTVGYNLVLLNGYDDGQAYTEQEYHDWLAEAGFEAFERVVFSDGTSILTARKLT